MDNRVTVIAVDGPSASGKSTVSRILAQRLGFNYVDSGAMYRAVTWKALEAGIDPSDTMQVLALLGRMKIHFEIVNREARMFIDGVDPGHKVREPRVAEKVSIIAAIPEVRQVLVQQQRSLTKFGSLVMEGRDIGSVVFPDTPHKFYLDADPTVRAQRRTQDFQAMKIQASTERVAEALQKRDQLDSSRSVSPLQIALGAVVINNSNTTAEQTVETILKFIQQQGGPEEARNPKSEIRNKSE